MIDFLIFFMSILVLFLVVNKLLIVDTSLIMVKSTHDGLYYIVRDLPNSVEAANKLSKINGKVMRLIDSLDKENPKYSRLIDRYNPNTLSETGENAEYISYSVNKGEKISICLRNKEDNTFEDDNIIMFVVLHELAHLITIDVGHTKKFWNNMKELLEKAEKINIYYPEDYSKKHIEYCGMTVKTTPYDFKK